MWERGGGEWLGGGDSKEKRSIYFSGRMGRAARACQWAPSRAGESGEGEKKCIQNNFKKLTFLRMDSLSLGLMMIRTSR